MAAQCQDGVLVGFKSANGVEVGNIELSERIQIQVGLDNSQRVTGFAYWRIKRCIALTISAPGLHGLTVDEVNDRNYIKQEVTTMRILVFEYVTGGGLLNEALPASLATEGDQMLRALVRDLAAIPRIEVVATRDDRLPVLDASVQEIRLNANDSFRQVWWCALDRVDAVWPIAPETGGVLERLCSDVLKAGKVLLNSPPASVNLAASKMRTLASLAEQGIPVVPAFTAQDFIPDSAGCWVVKPDDGVGCEGLRVFDSLQQARQAARGGILQPYLTGLDLSLSLICHQGAAKLLSVNRQQIRRTGDTLTLETCAVSPDHECGGSFAQLASRIAQAMPGLWGYVGVDLLQCEQDIRVLEVNPRLTSSYVALSSSQQFNPARQVLELLEQNGGDSWCGQTAPYVLRTTEGKSCVL